METETFVADTKGFAGTTDYTMAIFTAGDFCAWILNFNSNAGIALKTETFVTDTKGFAGTADYTSAILTAVYICAWIRNFNRNAGARF